MSVSNEQSKQGRKNTVPHQPNMKKILLVEDDPILGPVYESQLARAGFDATLARDGEAGLHALQQLTPDLVVLDIDLPKISGVELLKILRSTEGLETVPVIVFTSAFQQSVLDQIKEQKPNRTLIKSKHVPKEVLQIIRDLLRINPHNRANSTGNEDQNIQGDNSPISLLQKKLPVILEKCRRLAIDSHKSTASDIRSSKLYSLSGLAHNLASGATAAELKGQAYFCEALETLAKEVADNPTRTSESSLRTIIQAVDFLFEEFDFSKSMDVPEDLSFNVLVVDDDPISRRAICVALARIEQKAVDPKNIPEALEATKNQAFDLIFLDVNMPEMNGFDLCSEIRKTEHNRNTPVIFVTGQTDLQSRASSMLSGGNDFIEKPFKFMELAVKSLILLLRSKLH